MSAFEGFPPETFQFLKGIAEHNEKTWFEANRALYQAGFVDAGAAAVAALGPRLREISPAVQFAPKTNGSLSRIYRDVRFSKDKRPYKNHLDLWFWHGEKRSWDCPGFWFSLTAERLYVGGGMYRFNKEELDAYRQSVIHPRSGKALVAAVEGVREAGPYEIGEKTRKLMPRGFDTDPDRRDYLLYEGLTTMIELPVEAARSADLVDICMQHYRVTWPVTKWLLDEVV